jgi:hypothetical protein
MGAQGAYRPKTAGSGAGREPAVQTAKMVALSAFAWVRRAPVAEGHADAWTVAGAAPTVRAPARGVVKAERWRRVDAEGDAGGPATRWLVKVQTRLRATKDPNAEREAAVGFGCIRRSALPFTHATWHCLAFMIFDVPVVVVEMTMGDKP